MTTRTKLAMLAVLACVPLHAQTDIGVYPSTTWASTNLLVNRTLETGQIGQAIGYSANGVVAPITVSGGSGLPNVVIGVDDIATLTNTITPDLNGIERVMVSNHQSESATFFQAVGNGMLTDQTFWRTNTVPSQGLMTWDGNQVHLDCEAASAFPELTKAPPTAVIGERYGIIFECKANVPVSLYNSSTTSGESYYPSNNIGTNWTQMAYGFTAEQNTAITLMIAKTTYPALMDLWYRNVVVYGPGFSKVDGVEIFPSLDSMYAWKRMPVTGPPRVASATITDPELVYATSAVVPLLSVESVWAPNGIQLLQSFLKTRRNSTYPLTFNRRAFPDNAGTEIVTISTTNNQEAQSLMLTNIIPAGDIITLWLPTNDVEWIQASVAYIVLP